MKVAFFIGTLNRGGAETLLTDIFNQAKELPFEATCIYRREGNMSSAFHSTSVPMIQLSEKNWVLFCFRLRQLVKKENIQIVHAQSAFNAVIAIISLAFTKVRIVTTLHGVGFSTANIFYKYLVYRYSSRIVCVSEWERACYTMQASGGAFGRFVVIPNGINFSKFGYARLPVKEGETIRMCMVGNFVPEKDQYFICCFLKELKDRGCCFDFYFIGREIPSCKQYYYECVNYCEKNGLNECIHFLGACENVPTLLADMDAFIYSSKSETFGIAPVEAMAVGLPTFVNDLEVFYEVTRQGQLAVLYKTGELLDLCSKFDDFLLNRQEYYNKALSNSLKIRDLYSITNHINGLFSLYLQILS